MLHDDSVRGEAVSNRAYHAAPNTENPIAAAIPMAAKKYGLIDRNRNPRYAKSTSLSPLCSLRAFEMPNTSKSKLNVNTDVSRTRSRPSSFKPPAVAISRKGSASTRNRATRRVCVGEKVCDLDFKTRHTRNENAVFSLLTEKKALLWCRRVEESNQARSPAPFPGGEPCEPSFSKCGAFHHRSLIA